MAEFDRVLGGGLVPGSAILMGGNPGAGKSTLLLQACCHLASRMPALYITGEESPQQVAMRAQRLSLPLDAQADGRDQRGAILAALDSTPAAAGGRFDPGGVQRGAQSAPGSVSQVRECAASLTRAAKQRGTVLLLVGHVTKDGSSPVRRCSST
jgi:DNA repair protein RadA/Sms